MPGSVSSRQGCSEHHLPACYARVTKHDHQALHSVNDYFLNDPGPPWVSVGL